MRLQALPPCELLLFVSDPSPLHLAMGQIGVPLHREEIALDPLRILSVIPGDPHGTSMIFARNQVDSLAKAGMICRTFFLRSRTAPFQLLAAAQEFRREMVEFRPDVLHVHYGSMTALFCALLTTCPLVVSYQGSDLNPCPSINAVRSFVGRIFSQLVAIRAKRIICVSQGLRDRLWWNRSRASVIPSGVDLGVFHPMPKNEMRSELRWGEREMIVIFSAGAEPRVKRLDLAQLAVKKAETLCGGIRFVVLEGRTEQRMLAILFNAADCFLMTSDWEGSPNIVKEAIACNLPIVSVDVGDVKERLAHVRPSRIVGRDPAELGMALADLLRKPGRSNGYEIIQELSSEKVAERVVSLYREALGNC